MNNNNFNKGDLIMTNKTTGCCGLSNQCNTSDRIILKPSKSKNQWYWIIQASNGQVLATSEMYFSKQSATRTVKAFAKRCKMQWETQD